MEDYKIVTATTGEPVIATMVPENSPDVPYFRPSVEGISAYQLWQRQKEKVRLRKEHLDHWEATASATGTGRAVDAIISPAAAYAAPPHGYNRYFFLLISDDSAMNPNSQVYRLYEALEWSR